MRIGIISEGATDQITLENILIGYLQDRDLSTNPLQPKASEAGNWDKVFKYCKSDEFKQAFLFNDILIIHLDTDFLRRDGVPDEYKIDISNLSIEKTVAAVQKKLISVIGNEFYNEYQKQIIFAIAVDEIECWFLPIYFPTLIKKASKITGCIDTLNSELTKKEEFYIDKKEVRFYEAISKNFHKKRKLTEYSNKNPSFKIFIEELDAKLSKV